MSAIGSQKDPAIVMANLVLLKSLQTVEKQNPMALCDLLEKCKKTASQLKTEPSTASTDLLKGYSLINEDGSIHQLTRSLVLKTVYRPDSSGCALKPHSVAQVLTGKD